jgi:hypothetical protein
LGIALSVSIALVWRMELARLSLAILAALSFVCIGAATLLYRRIDSKLQALKQHGYAELSAFSDALFEATSHSDRQQADAARRRVLQQLTSTAAQALQTMVDLVLRMLAVGRLAAMIGASLILLCHKRSFALALPQQGHCPKRAISM